MQTKSRIFVCPYGKFPNRHAAAKVAEAKGLTNAFVKLSRLCEIEPKKYYYETITSKKEKAPTRPPKDKAPTQKQGSLTKVKLKGGNEVSWEEFSKWSEVRQRANLIPASKKTRNIQRDAAVKRWNDDEYRNKSTQAHIGKLHTDKTKLLLSILKGTAIVTPNGEFPSIRAAARAYNICDTTMRKWVWKNKTDQFYIKKN
jgi:hypothetical protein